MTGSTHTTPTNAVFDGQRAARVLPGDPDDLSTLSVVEQLSKGGSPAQAEMYRVDAGNDRLIDALRTSTPATLHLRHVLRRISTTRLRVTASVEDPHGHVHQIAADAMVVALPASTLRDVGIAPGLPERQHRAIHTLRYGCATKVVMQTPVDVFSNRRARAFATDSPLGAYCDGGEEQGGRSSIVTFLGGGSTSRQLTRRAAAGPEALLSDLCWLRVPGGRATAPPRRRRLPQRPGKTIRGHAAATAYVDPGFDPRLRDHLARRAGRLVFAGEHTSEKWQGYMNGAVEIGIARSAGAAEELPITQPPTPKAPTPHYRLRRPATSDCLVVGVLDVGSCNREGGVLWPYAAVFASCSR